MIPVEDDLFLVSAEAALDGASGDDALASLGWGDLLGSLEEDHEVRRAIFGYFRAQGRQLGSSVAVGRLMAHPYAELLGADLVGTGQMHTVAAEYTSPRRGLRVLILGRPTEGPLLIYRPGAGLVATGLSEVTLRRISTNHGLELHEVEADWAALSVVVPEEAARVAHERSVALGRMGLSLEILGAAETAFGLAVEHATDRVQFGKPIGSYQAIRHLLATARVELAAIEAVADRAVHLYPQRPASQDAILKALAGRNGRRVCEQSLQVLGGIGFTAEHAHHCYHSRVLALDGILGSSAYLTQRVAADMRATAGPETAADWLGPLTVS